MPSRLQRLEPHYLPFALTAAAAIFFLGLGWGLPSRTPDAFLFGDRIPTSGLGMAALPASLPSTSLSESTTSATTAPATVPAESSKTLPASEGDADTRSAPATTAASAPTTYPAGQDALSPAELAGAAEITLANGSRGADVDANPLDRPVDRPIVLNADPGGRAEIVRRYRLFSYQPDEMITFMSLARMRPGERDFDPRLYQYGGLWIYPVGFGLKLAASFGFLPLRSGIAYYLEEPASFARFYVVARVYVLLWGLAGVATVFAIVRTITGKPLPALAAALSFALLPVVVNMSHEAKPHLPGLVLQLLAVWTAAGYARTGRLAHAVAAGAVCGLAVGMVLSTAPVLAVLPAMILLRRLRLSAAAVALGASVAAAAAAYAMTNPYVAWHVLSGDMATVRSNLGNSATFYSVGNVLGGVVTSVRLIWEGAGVLGAVGAVAALVLGVRAINRRRDTSEAEVRRRSLGLLLALPAGLNFLQAALVGAGKPPEFGRFLLLTDVFLTIEVFALLGLARNERPIVALVLVIGSAWMGIRYLVGFAHDTRLATSRMNAAVWVEHLRRSGAKRVLLTAEPAPYCAPPVNLFDWPVVLVPRGADPHAYAVAGDVIVQVEDGSTPISWADKPFRIERVD